MPSSPHQAHLLLVKLRLFFFYPLVCCPQPCTACQYRRHNFFSCSHKGIFCSHLAVSSSSSEYLGLSKNPKQIHCHPGCPVLPPPDVPGCPRMSCAATWYMTGTQDEILFKGRFTLSTTGVHSFPSGSGGGGRPAWGTLRPSYLRPGGTGAEASAGHSPASVRRALRSYSIVRPAF